MKFIVKGTIEVEVTATIDADTGLDAQDQFDSADCCVESCDTNIVFDECSQNGSSVDSVECPASDKWDELSVLERANILKENGLSDDASIKVAQRDYLSEIDEELQEHFD